MIYIRNALSAVRLRSIARFTNPSDTQTVSVFCTSSLTSPIRRNFKSRFFVPDLLLPSGYSVVVGCWSRASRPEGISPVKAMKTDVCARKLDHGQTTRHNERPAAFGDMDGFSHVGLLRSRGCDIVIIFSLTSDGNYQTRRVSYAAFCNQC